MGKACTYTLDGLLNIDNNRAERAIKPFVIGRKWCLAKLPRATPGVLYRYRNGKANDLNVFEYVVCLDDRPPISSNLPWHLRSVRWDCQTLRQTK
ncbi:IS66 family transposase [Alteromonas mediterranea]|uniref:IS66 family transposase n=1 Tax=Alteromonas mediterranea TaxID=314275 RepID=UPI0003556D9D|nr:transposase [Alteromonas mediterranea U8]